MSDGSNAADRADRLKLTARIVRALADAGPMTGAELKASVGGDTFALWKAAMLAADVVTAPIGRRYMRLDRRVDGYARLSPSILREFLTYTVVGGADDPRVADRVAELEQHIATVSAQKKAFAKQIVDEIVAPFADPSADPGKFCVLLAGDIVYGMAHDVPRPERSTGSMVAGSDLDLVILVVDDEPDLVTALDEAIYAKKWQYLKNPALREEIDYIVKPLAKVAEQAQFDTFPRMVACKILDEAVLLTGSDDVFAAGLAMLEAAGVIGRLREMEAEAIASRAERQHHLLGTPDSVLRGEDVFLFYNQDESEEFE